MPERRSSQRRTWSGGRLPGPAVRRPAVEPRTDRADPGRAWPGPGRISAAGRARSGAAVGGAGVAGGGVGEEGVQGGGEDGGPAGAHLVPGPRHVEQLREALRPRSYVKYCEISRSYFISYFVKCFKTYYQK